MFLDLAPGVNAGLRWRLSGRSGHSEQRVPHDALFRLIYLLATPRDLSLFQNKFLAAIIVH